MSPKDSLNNSIAFPTGISLNNVAAHYTPTKNSSHIINNDDVIKIDYGVHNDGYIIDSAFTINLNNEYEVLLNASKDAIESVIKNVGVDNNLLN